MCARMCEHADSLSSSVLVVIVTVGWSLRKPPALDAARGGSSAERHRLGLVRSTRRQKPFGFSGLAVGCCACMPHDGGAPPLEVCHFRANLGDFSIQTVMQTDAGRLLVSWSELGLDGSPVVRVGWKFTDTSASATITGLKTLRMRSRLSMWPACSRAWQASSDRPSFAQNGPRTPGGSQTVS